MPCSILWRHMSTCNVPHSSCPNVPKGCQKNHSGNWFRIPENGLQLIWDFTRTRETIKIPLHLPRAPAHYCASAMHDLIYNTYFNPLFLVHCFYQFSSFPLECPVANYLIHYYQWWWLLNSKDPSRQMNVHKKKWKWYHLNYNFAYIFKIKTHMPRATRNSYFGYIIKIYTSIDNQLWTKEKNRIGISLSFSLSRQ